MPYPLVANPNATVLHNPQATGRRLRAAKANGSPQQGERVPNTLRMRTWPTLGNLPVRSPYFGCRIALLDGFSDNSRSKASKVCLDHGERASSVRPYNSTVRCLDVAIVLHQRKGGGPLSRYDDWSSALAVVPVNVQLIHLDRADHVLSRDYALVGMTLQEELATNVVPFARQDRLRGAQPYSTTPQKSTAGLVQPARHAPRSRQTKILRIQLAALRHRLRAARVEVAAGRRVDGRR